MRLQPATRRRLLPVLAAALLWLQALGLWHHVMHGIGVTGNRAVAAAADHDRIDNHAHAFAGHDEGDPQCRLYDQLTHADAAVGQASAAPVLVVSGEPMLATPAGRLAPQAAGFLARGPPLTA